MPWSKPGLPAGMAVVTTAGVRTLELGSDGLQMNISVNGRSDVAGNMSDGGDVFAGNEVIANQVVRSYGDVIASNNVSATNVSVSNNVSAMGTVNANVGISTPNIDIDTINGQPYPPT